MADAPKPQVTYLLDQDGQVVKVAAGDAQALVDAGYLPASEQQIHDTRLQEKYGGFGQQLKTGAEGAAQAVTLGASDYLEQAAGVSPEDIAAREEANPISHGIGTAVGTIAPLIATAGGSAAVEGAGALRGAASLTAPSLLARAGRGVTAAVEGVLPEATTTLGKMATKALAGAAGAGLEGAAYGAGHVVHEAALGDPNLTAQSALAEVGLSALLGGGIGGGVGALSQLAKGVGGGRMGEKLSGWLEDFEGERNAKAVGAIQSDINQALKRTSKENLNSMMREARDMGLVDTFTTPGAALEKAEAAMESSGKKMGDILEAADASGAAPKPIEDIAARVRKEVLESLEDNPLEKNTASSLRQILEGEEERFASQADTSIGFKQLHGLRRELDAKLYGLKGAADPDSTSLKAALHDMRGIVSDEINQGMESSGLGSNAWRAANREHSVAATVAKFAEKGLTRAHGNNMVSPTELLSAAAGLIHGGPMGAAAMGAATAVARRFASGALGTAARGMRGYLESGAAKEVAGNTAEAIATARQAGADTLTQAATNQPESVAALSVLHEANQRVAAKLDKAADALVKGADVAAHLASPGAAEATHAAFEKRAERVNQLAATPEGMLAAMERATGDMHEHAPQAAQAAQVALTRAVSMLHATLPKPKKLGPMGPTLKPTKSAVAKWSRLHAALERPMSLLRHAHEGTLTPDMVDAVRTAYPALHARMVESVLSAAADGKGTTPYRTKLMLGILVGQPVDGTASGQAIAANQAAYSLPSQKSGEDMTGPGAMGKTNQSGLNKLNLASAARLPGQASAARTRGEA